MNYKKIFRTPVIRQAILSMLCFIPDTMMLRLQYRIKLGRSLDLKNPVRFTEKIQWYKINYRNPVMHRCVDKYQVRDYVKSKGMEETLVPIYAHYHTIDQVEWDKLPEQFVVKTQNGGGGLNVVVCRDKSKLDFSEIKQKLKCRKKKARYGGREWAYYDSEPGIVVEQLLINDTNPEAGVNDYKIFCYSGKPEYIVVDVDRYSDHKRNFYDIHWNNLHITSDCPAADREIERPDNLDEMLQAASKLSEDFPYVRVDLYNTGGKVYFGELTFYPWSGYVQYTPDCADFEFGKDFELKRYQT